MRKTFITIAALSAALAFTSCGGQKTETAQEQNFNNPFIRHLYTADPSAHVWADGRLYVYPSRDMTPDNCDGMDNYHVFSTDDMLHWTDHGRILRAADVPWQKEALNNNAKFMWAPDCAYKNGKYYFYFPHPDKNSWNDNWKIGIAVSDKPASDFKVLPEPLKGLPEKGEIDPCVFIDEDGQAYFYYGGGGHSYGAKLKDNMTELDGELQEMQGLQDFHEATWVHKRNGIYYLSYSDNHDEGNDTEGVKGDNRMRYATSNSPLGPWEYKGIYMEPTDSYTNHGSIVEYKGQWYAFYHNSELSTINGEWNDWQRSICVDKLFYNEDGTIQLVQQTK
ncbi:MAG: family 43 glycosylhydrolase [Prevotellaceae bacterium]|jgi:beta-xylosidase|nr:family 43 glycosylhydrolase [Prevotellaceae bacterium]